MKQGRKGKKAYVMPHGITMTKLLAPNEAYQVLENDHKGHSFNQRNPLLTVTKNKTIPEDYIGEAAATSCNHTINSVIDKSVNFNGT